jgi:hypothetical protein
VVRFKGVIVLGAVLLRATHAPWRHRYDPPFRTLLLLILHHERRQACGPQQRNLASAWNPVDPHDGGPCLCLTCLFRQSRLPCKMIRARPLTIRASARRASAVQRRQGRNTTEGRKQRVRRWVKGMPASVFTHNLLFAAASLLVAYPSAWRSTRSTTTVPITLCLWTPVYCQQQGRDYPGGGRCGVCERCPWPRVSPPPQALASLSSPPSAPIKATSSTKGPFADLTRPS